MSSLPPDFQVPPGTVRLYTEDGTRVKHDVLRQPQPSTDPNDPLNWSMKRKALNFVPLLWLTAVNFTQLSIGGVFWQLWVPDLNVDFNQLNIASAIGQIGCAFGCIFFIPLAVKYGRRPIYLVSLAICALYSLWTALMTNVSSLYAIQMINGLAGSVNETIVQMTIADIFFVHQRGTGNALYMLAVMAGSFLSGVIAGYQANDGDWRQCFWILFGLQTFLFVWFLFLYEESKYVALTNGIAAPVTAPMPVNDDSDGAGTSTKSVDDRKDADVTDLENTAQNELTRKDTTIDPSIPVNTYRQRMRLLTKTDENLMQITIRPFIILFKFPVVMYTALQYSFGLAWISVIGSTIAIIFPYEPYNMSPSGIGLMSLGSFVGCVIASAYGGLLSDWSITFFARRNHGFYEPEMRLHILHLPFLAQAAGLIMFGITTAKGMPWIYPSVGSAIFGFGLGSISDIALTLTMDSYRAVTGEAFVAVTFIRNLASIAFFFAIVPWFAAQGIEGMYIVITVMSLVFAGLYIPLIIWGKKIRTKTAKCYLAYAEQKHEVRL